MITTTSIEQHPTQIEFEQYKAKHPYFFPIGTPLVKQLCVFSVIKDILKKRELKKLSDTRTAGYRRRV